VTRIVEQFEARKLQTADDDLIGAFPIVDGSALAAS
jgi:hypothetical protein